MCGEGPLRPFASRHTQLHMVEAKSPSLYFLPNENGHIRYIPSTLGGLKIYNLRHVQWKPNGIAFVLQSAYRLRRI
nr:MAG TPA: hypothetical protein [Caudoviricetes sp.]